MAKSRRRKTINRNDVTEDGTPHRGHLVVGPNRATFGGTPAANRAANGNDFAERRLAAGLQSATTLPDNEIAKPIDAAVASIVTEPAFFPVVNDIGAKREVVFDPKVERIRRRQEKITALQQTIFGAVRELSQMGVFDDLPQTDVPSPELMSAIRSTENLE